jgi:hypothetical protein
MALTTPVSRRKAQVTCELTSDFTVTTRLYISNDDVRAGDGQYSVHDSGSQRRTSTSDSSHHSTLSSGSGRRDRGDVFVAILLGTAGAFVVIAFIIGVVLLASFRRRRRSVLARGGHRRSGRSGIVGGGFARDRGALLKSAVGTGEASSSSASSSPEQRPAVGGSTKFSVNYLSPLVSSASANESGKCVLKGGNMYNAVSTTDPMEHVVFVASGKQSAGDVIVTNGNQGRGMSAANDYRGSVAMWVFTEMVLCGCSKLEAFLVNRI